MMTHTIVVIDDHRETLQLVCEVLHGDHAEHDPGHMVIGLSAPCYPGEIVFKGGPHVIVVDLMLHSMSGIEWARAVRGQLDINQHRDPLTPRTRLIAYSASDLFCDAARESGLFDAVIGKPFDISELMYAARPQHEGSSATPTEPPS